MIHYTCDLCGKELDLQNEVRYEVNIEVKAAFDTHQITEDDLCCDLEDGMSELIDLMEELDCDDVDNGVYRTFRFDLCTACRTRYLKDPLFRRSFRRSGFSEN